MAEAKQVDPTEKLSKDLAFWRGQYEKLENISKELAAENTRLKSDIADRIEKLASSRAVGDEIRDERDQAKRLLRKLAEHTAGRDGMLQISRTFCDRCEGSGLCVLKEVNDFLNPAEAEAT